MALSVYTANKLLDLRYGADTFTAPATIYIGLYTAAPTDAGGGVEVTGGSYARVAVTNDATNWPAASGKTKSNGVAFAFAAASALWGTVTYVGLFDAVSAGNLLDYAPLTASRTVNSGDVFSFAIGQLILSAA